MTESVCSKNISGFGLIELLIALAVLTFGLLASGQLFYVAASSGSLAGSKGSAAIAAQNMLESLSDLYSRNPLAGDLTIGSHGPRLTQVTNPVNGAVLNRYGISWEVSPVLDPRPAKAIDARLVRVIVMPIQSGGAINNRPPLNKALNITTIFSPTMQ
jgi:prepilin-type N-terminal cleavage/methylation domain-containing protein